jgi:hypothetical protein
VAADLRAAVFDFAAANRLPLFVVERVDLNALNDAAGVETLKHGPIRTTRWGQRVPPAEFGSQESMKDFPFDSWFRGFRISEIEPPASGYP